MLLRRDFARWALLALLLLPVSFGRVLAQEEVFQKNGDAWPVVPMSPGRSDDAYAIYSYLVPGEFPNAGIENKPLWLIATPTVVVNEELMSPRKGLVAPQDQQQAMAALLADYDQHKYEHAILERNFHLQLPYRLLDRAAQAQYIQLKKQSDAERNPALLAPFQNAQGLVFFSNVYFNFDHTLAMVYVVRWCGTKCGDMNWVALAKTNGDWSRLKWTADVGHF